jgi:DNA-binding XRE family transcriptional regulator
MPTKKPKITSDAIEILHQRYFAGQPQRLAELEEARASAAIARTAYGLRTKARLSQEAMAQRIGVAKNAIANLEDDDFEGDALGLLQRIAAALNKSVEIRIVPRKPKRRAA